MAYKVDWAGSVALGVIEDNGRKFAFSLEENQSIPEEFREGDALEITNHPSHPAHIAMGMGNSGFYEITHIKSGKILRTMHRADEYKVGTNF
jgi:hypothetical protein